MKNNIYFLIVVLITMFNSQLIAQNPADSTDIYGCTDQAALNYNPLATIDDGYCIYQNDSTVFDIYGCTDPIALNYNPLATINDGSCVYFEDSTGTGFIYGCTDPAGVNFNPLATFDDGSCVYQNDTTTFEIYGCTDPDALNYNFFATIDDGSCILPNDSLDIYGCMTPAALNYNPFATIDDGSCFYGNDSLEIYGCTDPEALNYNFFATIDDGLCIYFSDSTIIYGCTDQGALNFNPLATVNDGSCIYQNDSTVFDIYGCMDPAALNYNPWATIDNGSCYYFNDTNYCEASYLVQEINEEEGYITLINLSYGNNLSYYWDFGDSTFSTDAFPTHVYELAGLYTVCLTVTGGTPNGGFNCSSTYCDTIGITLFQKSLGFTLNVIPNEVTGVEENIEQLSKINLFPNPANEQLTIGFSSKIDEVFTMNIYDLSGKIVKTINTSITSGENRINIEINDLSPGLYQLELRNNDERKVKRFQVIR